MRFDPEAKPGVSNLLSILAAATGGDAATLADDYDQYGPLKNDCADAVISLLEPIAARRAELLGDPGEMNRVLAMGAAKANDVAAQVFGRVQSALGIGAPGL